MQRTWLFKESHRTASGLQVGTCAQESQKDFKNTATSSEPSFLPVPDVLTPTPFHNKEDGSGISSLQGGGKDIWMLKGVICIFQVTLFQVSIEIPVPRFVMDSFSKVIAL